MSSTARAGPFVLVVGSANIDLVVRAETIPRAGETILGGDLAVVAGGKGANQAVAAARLGAACELVARVGDDDFGRRLLAGLRAAGVGLEHLGVTAGCPTGAALIVVSAAGENAICVSPGANARLAPADLDAAEPAFARAAVCLLQLEVPIETVLHALDLCRRHHVTVVLDPAPVPPTVPDELLRVDVLTPNAGEAESLTSLTLASDLSNAPLLAEALRARGAQAVVLTLGSHGTLACDAKGCTHLSAHQVSVVDTTAAGDAFNGALAAALASGAGLHQAVRLANAAGALACTRPGAQPAMPAEAEVARLSDGA